MGVERICGCLGEGLGVFGKEGGRCWMFGDFLGFGRLGVLDVSRVVGVLECPGSYEEQV